MRLRRLLIPLLLASPLAVWADPPVEDDVRALMRSGLEAHAVLPPEAPSFPDETWASPGFETGAPTDTSSRRRAASAAAAWGTSTAERARNAASVRAREAMISPRSERARDKAADQVRGAEEKSKARPNPPTPVRP